MSKMIASFEEVSYKNGRNNVVDDVTFSLEKNTITTLMGPNGAGKTTIAKLLLGIKKTASGKVVRNSSNIAYVPQKIELNQDMPLNANSLLKLLASDYNQHEMIDELFEFASIKSLFSRSLHDLSGGQLQRLIIASSILKNPELLVLDEPTQYLDIDGQEEFYSILGNLKKRANITIFVISHDLFTVMKKSDQVLCLNHHLCCSGKPTHTIVKNSKNIGIYSHVHDHTHR